MPSANYLKATGLQLCLLLNFGKPRLKIKRMVHSPRTALNHLRVLRASFFICVKTFLVLQRHRARNAGPRLYATQTLRATTKVCSIGQNHCAWVLAARQVLSRVKPSTRRV
jgi:hypothetical protein